MNARGSDANADASPPALDATRLPTLDSVHKDDEDDTLFMILLLTLSLLSLFFLSFRYAFVIPFCLFSTMCISITIKY
jgi:hypothetical protein